MDGNAGQLNWTHVAVRDALAEAFKVLSASEGRVGHRPLKAFWPDHAVEWEDLLAQQEHGTQKKAGVPKLRPTSRQIERMELILLGKSGKHPWLNGIVCSYPTGRKMLIAGSMARAHRYSSRQLCEAMGWPEATYRWQRDRAAGMIADELNRIGLKPW